MKHHLSMGLKLIGLLVFFLSLSSCQPPRYWRQGSVISTVNFEPGVVTKKQTSWSVSNQPQVSYEATYTLNTTTKAQAVSFDINMLRDQKPKVEVLIDGVSNSPEIETLKTTPKMWVRRFEHQTPYGPDGVPLYYGKHKRYHFTVPAHAKQVIVRTKLTVPQVAVTEFYRGLLLVEHTEARSFGSSDTWSVTKPDRWLEQQNTKPNHGLRVKVVHAKQPNVSWIHPLWQGVGMLWIVLWLIGTIWVCISERRNLALTLKLMGLTGFSIALFFGTFYGQLALFDHYLDPRWKYTYGNPALFGFMLLCLLGMTIWFVIVPITLMVRAYQNRKQI